MPLFLSFFTLFCFQFSGSSFLFLPTFATVSASVKTLSDSDDELSESEEELLESEEESEEELLDDEEDDDVFSITVGRFLVILSSLPVL